MEILQILMGKKIFLQIVNDVFALYVSGDMSQDLAMKILDYLDQEISLTVWESVLSGFEMLKIENAGCGMTRLIYSEWQVGYS